MKTQTLQVMCFLEDSKLCEAGLFKTRVRCQVQSNKGVLNVGGEKVVKEPDKPPPFSQPKIAHPAVLIPLLMRQPTLRLQAQVLTLHLHPIHPKRHQHLRLQPLVLLLSQECLGWSDIQIQSSQLCNY